MIFLQFYSDTGLFRKGLRWNLSDALLNFEMSNILGYYCSSIIADCWGEGCHVAFEWVVSMKIRWRPIVMFWRTQMYMRTVSSQYNMTIVNYLLTVWNPFYLSTQWWWSSTYHDRKNYMQKCFRIRPAQKKQQTFTVDENVYTVCIHASYYWWAIRLINNHT